MCEETLVAVLSAGAILHSVCEERGHELIIQDLPPVKIPDRPWPMHRGNKRHMKEGKAARGATTT